MLRTLKQSFPEQGARKSSSQFTLSWFTGAGRKPVISEAVCAYCALKADVRLLPGESIDLLFGKIFQETY